MLCYNCRSKFKHSSWDEKTVRYRCDCDTIWLYVPTKNKYTATNELTLDSICGYNIAGFTDRISIIVAHKEGFALTFKYRDKARFSYQSPGLELELECYLELTLQEDGTIDLPSLLNRANKLKVFS